MATELEATVIGFLRADPALGALVGNRIYSDIAPEDATWPHIVTQVISQPQEYAVNVGPIGLVHTRLQVSCWGKGATGKSDAVAVAKAVRTSQGGVSTGPQLDGFHGTMIDLSVQLCKLEDRRRSSEGPVHGEEYPFRRIDLDFAITHSDV